MYIRPIRSCFDNDVMVLVMSSNALQLQMVGLKLCFTGDQELKHVHLVFHLDV